LRQLYLLILGTKDNVGMVPGPKPNITPADRPQFAGLERAAAMFGRRPWLVLFGCLLLLSIVTIPLSATRRFWYDELFTVGLCNLPQFGRILQALSDGVDAQPPMLYIATRAARNAFGPSELATRLPALAGFALLTICVFWFVCRRTSALWGAVAVLIVMVTGAYDYAYEARPYGLYLGFSALAFLCWQFAADGRFRKIALAGLWAALALAISSHYYAVLVLFPLLLGECARGIKDRRLDWPVLASIVLPSAFILFYLPLMGGSISLAAHPALPARVSILWQVFESIFTQAAVPLALCLVALFLVSGAEGERRPSGQGLSTAEAVACLGFLALPLPGFLMARVAGLELTARYLLPVIIGAAPLIAGALWKSVNRRAASAALLILILGGWFAGRHAWDMRGITRPGPLVMPAGTGSDSLPLVIANPLIFLEYLHYGTPAVLSRAVYVADPDLALRYLGTDSLDRNLQLAQPYFSLPLMTWGELRQTHPRFDLLLHPGPFVWLPERVLAEGARETLLSQGGGVFTFEVEWNNGPEPASAITQPSPPEASSPPQTGSAQTEN